MSKGEGGGELATESCSDRYHHDSAILLPSRDRKGDPKCGGQEPRAARQGFREQGKFPASFLTHNYSSDMSHVLINNTLPAMGVLINFPLNIVCFLVF